MSATALPSLADFRSALIVKPSSLGDIVHTMPAVHAVHQAYPNLQLRWVANTEWTPLLQGAPWLDEIIPFPRQTFRGPIAIFKASSWAKATLPAKHKPEIVFDFQGLFRSALLARASGSSPIVGLSDSREGARYLHDCIIPVDATAHAVDRYLALPRAFGIDVAPDTLSFPLASGQAPKDWPLIDEFIVIHPWSRGVGKSLSHDTLQALCDALSPHPVALVGMSEDKKRPEGTHIIDFSHRTTLAELIWVLRQARWVISVDSGPMHIAAAVNDHTLGIHTWSDPRKVGPYNPRSWVWKAGRIARRQDFNPAECLKESEVKAEDAGQIAAFILGS